MMGQQNHLTDDTPIYGSIKSIWYYLEVIGNEDAGWVEEADQ